MTTSTGKHCREVRRLTMFRLLICVFNLFKLSDQVVLESLRNNWSAWFLKKYSTRVEEILSFYLEKMWNNGL